MKKSEIVGMFIFFIIGIVFHEQIFAFFGHAA
jgi:hypothetical protein